MTATTRRTVITAGEEIAVTIDPGVQAPQLTGLGGHRSDRAPAANNKAPQPPAQRGTESGAPKPFRNDKPRFQRRDEQAPRPEVEPAAVQIDFLPEERAFSKIIQQIKQGHIAYPLFGLARMFLERPERHRIRVRSLDNHTMIYQFGDDGPVAMDPTALERNAFNDKKDEFYDTQIVEKEPIKGNYSPSPVAPCLANSSDPPIITPFNRPCARSTIKDSAGE